MSDAEFKDHFSTTSDRYRDYRPHYPPELFEFLAAQCEHHQLAWDCATGSGQAACMLTKYFHRVVASDASKKQIDNAISCEGVEYKVMPAEHTAFDDASVDLITVAQALHWFELDVFFTEVERVLKPHGLLAIWTYQTLRIDDGIDNIINKLYSDTLKNYWPAERRSVEQGYANIAFPWSSVDLPQFNMQARWTIDQLIGYLGTWSAINAYIKARNSDPLVTLREQLSVLWGDANTLRTVEWPLTLHLFRPNQTAKK